MKIKDLSNLASDIFPERFYICKQLAFFINHWDTVWFKTSNQVNVLNTYFPYLTDHHPQLNSSVKDSQFIFTAVDLHSVKRFKWTNTRWPIYWICLSTTNKAMHRVNSNTQLNGPYIMHYVSFNQQVEQTNKKKSQFPQPHTWCVQGNHSCWVIVFWQQGAFRSLRKQWSVMLAKVNSTDLSGKKTGWLYMSPLIDRLIYNQPARTLHGSKFSQSMLDQPNFNPRRLDLAFNSQLF